MPWASKPSPTAHRKMAATVENAANAPSKPAASLTAQQTQSARLARDGLSNPEIGTWPFIRARTVQYHLDKVFTELGISSRSQPEHVLPPAADAA
jgi:DNA-binding NarL/FixJ family response regulator